MAVYFIQDDALHLIKIGSAGDPKARLQTLQIGSAAPLVLLAVVDGDCQAEQALHERFKEYRVQGEWFRPGPRLLAYLLDSVRQEPGSRTSPGQQGRGLSDRCPRTHDQFLELVAHVAEPRTRRLLIDGLTFLWGLLFDAVDYAETKEDLPADRPLPWEVERMRRYLGRDGLPGVSD